MSDFQTEVDSWFERLLDADEASRDALAATIPDPAVRAEVRSLFEHHQPEGRWLEAVVGDAAHGWAGADASHAPFLGRRIGAYEITGLLGEGGMGAVYRGRRVDGEFDHDVALKLVRTGFETPFALDRFRLERQILASLRHPSIARLLDGGTVIDDTGRHIPYLVMEYVDGDPISTYAKARDLTINDRLRLFLGVCDAVQYAHQQFVVHRDLKPANILVDTAGRPRLLDFGIAKILSDAAPGDTGSTETGHRLLTPDYASPEQIRGEPTTAATDVYALGAVLYELLSGAKAHQFQTLSAREVERVICETEPVKPSAALTPGSNQPRLHRVLRGDLDTIVLKAMHRDGSRRYQSVEQFAEDIRRHLGGLPVLARPDALGFRAGKFLARHRVATSVAVGVALTLVSALLFSMREERARAAEARRAEHRFQQVRQLANHFLFDVDDALRDVPGTGNARRVLAQTSIDYLDSLWADLDAFQDEGLMLEIAVGLERLATMSGASADTSSGREDARENYRRAIALRERLSKTRGRFDDNDRAIQSLRDKLAALDAPVQQKVAPPAAAAPSAAAASLAVSPQEKNVVKAASAAPVLPSPRVVDHAGMARIPGGSFMMGSPETEEGRFASEGPATSVDVAAFWLDVHEVTVAEYSRFVQAHPQWRKENADLAMAGVDYLVGWSDLAGPASAQNHPVVSVSWFAAVAYCDSLGKRLPTEAEWEFAARAGTTTAYYWGDTWDPARAVAGVPEPQAVGQAAHKNPWGLFDMLGNAFEWTATERRPYPYDPGDGRETPSPTARRSIRGGAFSLPPKMVRVAVRDSLLPGFSSTVVGFRCAQ
jgi:formylglycine-generating enzyme required for sulfatase activity